MGCESFRRFRVKRYVQLTCHKPVCNTYIVIKLPGVRYRHWPFFERLLHLYIRAVFNWVSKVVRFCFTTLCDCHWLKRNSRLGRPRVFPRLVPVTCICFEFSLVHGVAYICCDWSLKLLWFLLSYTVENRWTHACSFCSFSVFLTMVLKGLVWRS